MRTTVTLDADVAASVKELARHGRTNPFVVEPHDGRFRPAVDPARLNQLVDELEVENFTRETRRSRRSR